MNHHYVVRTKENRLYGFFYEQEQIHIVQHYQNRWLNLEIPLQHVQKQFSCCEMDDGNLYLFTKDLEGNLKICLFDGHTIREKVMKKAGETPLGCFFVSVNSGKITLIYSMIQNQNSQILAYQFFENGVWSQPEKIDTILPLRNSPFYVHKVTATHYIIFYRNTQDCTLGYREISTDGRLGQYQIFHSSNSQLIGHSFMTTENSIHMLYILRGLFTTQLIYRNKTGGQLSAPAIIWESPQMESCCLFSHEGQLWASWMYGNQLYYAKSENGGKTFHKPVRYQDAIAKQYYKAEYISNPPFYGNELYVAQDNPQNILFLPKVQPSFYPTPEVILAKPEPSTFSAETAEDPFLATQKQLTEAQRQLEEQAATMMQIQKESHQRAEPLQQLETRFDKQISIFTNKIQTLEEETLQQKETLKQIKHENEQIKIVLGELKNLIENKLADTPQKEDIIILPEEKRILLSTAKDDITPDASEKESI